MLLLEFGSFLFLLVGLSCLFSVGGPLLVVGLELGGCNQPIANVGTLFGTLWAILPHLGHVVVSLSGIILPNLF